MRQPICGSRSASQAGVSQKFMRNDAALKVQIAAAMKVAVDRITIYAFPEMTLKFSVLESYIDKVEFVQFRARLNRDGTLNKHSILRV